jgi:hypothetical protein
MGNVILAIAAPKFGPKKLYANRGKDASSVGKNLYAVIWNHFDQTNTPAQV